MFYKAHSFNGDISGWDTSNVVYMTCMFTDATSFNVDIKNWDTSYVTDMTFMFRNATSFDGDISSWDTSKVIYMTVSLCFPRMYEPFQINQYLTFFVLLNI